ncbi:hypothetical protein LDENG_00217570 [Lucifuga dentata]|nr:hypothetical protein LDENG_00217570 [Lucifuga dentata]
MILLNKIVGLSKQKLAKIKGSSSNVQVPCEEHQPVCCLWLDAPSNFICFFAGALTAASASRSAALLPLSCMFLSQMPTFSSCSSYKLYRPH